MVKAIYVKPAAKLQVMPTILRTMRATKEPILVDFSISIHYKNDELCSSGNRIFFIKFCRSEKKMLQSPKSFTHMVNASCFSQC